MKYLCFNNFHKNHNISLAKGKALVIGIFSGLVQKKGNF